MDASLGGLRLTDEVMDAACAVPFTRGQAVAFSNRCPGKETANEDAAAVISLDPVRGVLVVADGLGGRPEGQTAAELAIRSLERSLRSIPIAEGGLRPAVLDGVEDANRLLLEKASGAATTLAIAEIDGATMRPYHVGDSAILVVGQRGRVKLETISHSPVGYAVEAGVLHPEDAIHHEDRHLISNVVGDSDMRIEVGSPLALAARDTVLLASDGLFDNLRAEEIIAIVRAGPLLAAGNALAREAARRMGGEASERHPSKPDDLTFILYRAS